MSNALHLLRRWNGLWTGEVEPDSGALLNVRITFSTAMEGHGSVFHVEVIDPASGGLVRGLRMLFAEGPDRVVQTVAFSTQLGLFGLEQTADDEDVLALAGVTESGVQLNVAFREEEPDTLMFTVIWRPHGTSLPRDARPGLFGRIRRRQPWRPEQGHEIGKQA